MRVDIVRTNSENPDFVTLVQLLDKDLASRYGEKQKFYNQFNKIDTISEVIVAYSNGIPVGCGAIKKYDEQSMEVKRMYVRDEYRRNGIATTILKALEEWALELGYSHCILETGNKQSEAIQAYKKYGYQVTDNYGQYVGVETSVCMKKAV